MAGSKQRKGKRPRNVSREVRALGLMPSRGATKKFLRATFDVSGFTQGQINELMLELCAQAEASDGHPDTDTPTFDLTTMKFEGHGEARMCVSMETTDHG